MWLKIFSGENTKIVSALKDQEIEAIPVIGDILSAMLITKLGLLVILQKLIPKIKDIISSGGIPVIVLLVMLTQTICKY